MIVPICYSCFKQYDDEFDICPYCGQEMITEPEEPIYLHPGVILNERYVIGKCAGQGGFGIVYKAWDKKLGTIVAVKEFFSSKIAIRYPGESEVRISRKHKDEFLYRKSRFLTEARYISKFIDQKSIVDVYDHFEQNGTAYIVMEYLRGVNLSQYLEQHGGRIDQKTAITIINQLCSGLSELHKEKVIHCDIAPDNIQVYDGYQIKLYDFGAAKLADSNEVAIDVVMKPGYSPPEQYSQDNELGAWTDIYALGATFYKMLIGKIPEESTNRKINDTLKAPHEINPEIPENLSNIIMKAMAVEKHMRFKSVDEFMQALNSDKKVYTIEQEKKRRKRRRHTGILAATLVVAAVCGAVYYSFSQKKLEEKLKPATVSVWFCVDENSTEEDAMNAVKKDFEEKFPDITIELRAIKKDQYAQELEKAAAENKLPALFESTDLPDSVLEKARDANKVLKSEQSKDCLFIDQYDNYYSDKKKIPLAIEVPTAYIISKGEQASDYSSPTFDSISDFGTDKIAVDSQYTFVKDNFSDSFDMTEADFTDDDNNKAAVLISSSMKMNEVRKMIQKHPKACSFYDSDKIYCSYTYEWSLGDASRNEEIAAERLLSWMLGNVYQSDLMISRCSDGQIPINETCFNSKCSNKNYEQLKQISNKFVFGS